MGGSEVWLGAAVAIQIALRPLSTNTGHWRPSRSSRRYSQQSSVASSFSAAFRCPRSALYPRFRRRHPRAPWPEQRRSPCRNVAMLKEQRLYSMEAAMLAFSQAQEPASPSLAPAASVEAAAPPDKPINLLTFSTGVAQRRRPKKRSLFVAVAIRSAIAYGPCPSS